MFNWDMTKLTMKDVMTLSSAEVDGRAAFDIVDRCHVGGAEAIPALQIAEAFRDFMKSYAEAVNPKVKVVVTSVNE